MNLSKLPPRSLVFWTILMGLVLLRAPDLAAEGLPSAAFREMITTAAMGEGVDPGLVEAMVAVESGFTPWAVSRKGAMGLMQLMPQTARLYGVSNAFDPRENLSAGIRHLRDLLHLFDGDLPRALAAYNAGANAVLAYNGIPPYRETLEYVLMVLARYQPRPVPPPASSAPAGSPASELTRVRDEAEEDNLSFAATRPLKTAVRRPLIQGVRGPLVQVRAAPTILVKFRSRGFSPDRGD